MDKHTLIALLDALIDDKISEIEPIKGERGLRGPRGLSGDSFNFKDNEKEVRQIVDEFINKKKQDFKLTEEEKQDFKLKFTDLTDEEKTELKGEDGKGFVFNEHIDDIAAMLPSKDDLKLRFDDLTEEDKDSLKVKGARGQRGRPGTSFNFEEEKERITDIILSLYNNTKDTFKLKFNELTDEEKEELKLKFKDLTEEEVESLKVRGPRGQRGKSIKGDTGATWLTGTGKPKDKLIAKAEDLYLDTTTGDTYKWVD